MAEKITVLTISKAQAKANDYPKGRYIWDSGAERGFGVWVGPTGKASFVIVYQADKPGGGRRQRIQTIGHYGREGKDGRVWTIDHARSVAKGLKSKIKHHGFDPLDDDEASAKAEAEAKEARAKAKTFRQAVEAFYDLRAALRAKENERTGRQGKDGGDAEMRRLTLADTKDWHNRPLTEITQGEISERLQAVAIRSAAVARNLYFGLLGTFRHSAQNGWSPNVMLEGVLTGGEGAWKPEGCDAREHSLTDEELRILWTSLAPEHWDDELAGKKHPYPRIVKLLLAIGCRRDEMAGLRHEWLNLAEGIICIPRTEMKVRGTRARKSKKKRGPYTIYLPALAVAILSDWLKDGMTTEGLIFPVRGKDGKPAVFSAWSKSKAKLDGHMTEALGGSLNPWRLHDLRRSCNVRWDERLDIPKEIRDMLLDHSTDNQTDNSYEVAKRVEKRRNAWARWGDLVQEICAA
jgi:integrase